MRCVVHTRYSHLLCFSTRCPRRQEVIQLSVLVVRFRFGSQPYSLWLPDLVDLIYIRFSIQPNLVHVSNSSSTLASFCKNVFKPIVGSLKYLPSSFASALNTYERKITVAIVTLLNPLLFHYFLLRDTSPKLPGKA